MNKIVIGVDPDSKKHGVAIYKNRKLVDLKSMATHELVDSLKSALLESDSVVLHVEDLLGVSAAFTARDSRMTSDAQKFAICQSTGMCKQAQAEVENWAESLGVKVVRHRISSSWKSQRGKKDFERFTGWQGRSNQDTRSAAYFGFLGCQ